LHNYCKPQTEQGVLLLTVSLISEKANLTRHKKGIFIMLDSFPLHGISPKKKLLVKLKPLSPDGETKSIIIITASVLFKRFP